MPQKELIIVVQIVHGICYAFFFATVYIFVDEHFPKDVRSSAQGLVQCDDSWRVGALVANTVCPYLMQEVYTKDGVIDFHGLFLVPMAAAIIASLAMAIFFHPPKINAVASGTPVTGH
jgi:MFS family permease